MPRVTVMPQGLALGCAEGANLGPILREAGVFLEMPCGGRGTCGKCAVEIEGRRTLACQYAVTGDATVRLLGDGTYMQGILDLGYLPPFEADPAADGACGVALDIGTTTLACTLVSLSTGKPLASASALNAQGAYGADVLTRITYEIENGRDAICDLQSAIVVQVDDMLASVCAEAAIEGRKVQRIAVAANCAMLHMLLGRDVRPLGMAPYRPQFTETQRLPAAHVGLHATPAAEVICLPSVSAYIGADIVAGVRACELDRAKDVALLMDIGTNGEIVLCDHGRLSCCSSAAGPALEGMNISSGMQARPGAVEDLRITDEGVALDVIGNVPARGLCGSGVLAAMRELQKHGFLEKNGAFVKPDTLPEGDIRTCLLRSDGKKRVFAFGSKEAPLTVTQRDIREVQLAKGAILSGFLTLLRRAHLELSDVDRVLVAGQFGAHVSAESLTGAGLVPESLGGRISYVGNSSKSGAYLALMSNAVIGELDDLARRIEYVELSSSPGYERLFSECLQLKGRTQ